MKNKIKFLNAKEWWTHELLLEDFVVVNPPIPHKNLPDGEYLIRGTKRNHDKEYWVFEGVWYFVFEHTTNSGQYCSRSTIYQLFPILPESEYESLYNHYDRLSEQWKLNVSGHFHWNELRQIGRDTNKMCINL